MSSRTPLSDKATETALSVKDTWQSRDRGWELASVLFHTEPKSWYCQHHRPGEILTSWNISPRAEGDLKVPLIPVQQLLEFSPQYFHQWLHNCGNCCLNMFTDKNLLSHLVALTQKNLPHLDPKLSTSSPSVTHYLLHPSLSISATVSSSQRKSITGSFNALYIWLGPLCLCVCPIGLTLI